MCRRSRAVRVRLLEAGDTNEHQPNGALAGGGVSSALA